MGTSRAGAYGPTALEGVRLAHPFRRIGRLRLHCVEAGPPNGPLALLLHGFPEGWWGWHRQIAPLALAGLRVVVLTAHTDPSLVTRAAAAGASGFLPKDGAQPYYFRDQVDVPLKTSSDTATFEIQDVTPGDYVVTCLMDTIGGGFMPGSGDAVNLSAPMVTAVAGQTASKSSAFVIRRSGRVTR